MSCGGCGSRIRIKVDKPEMLKSPVIDQDGVIVFPQDQEEIPVIDGYTVDEENPLRLIPNEDAHCVWKITGIMLQKSGSYRPHHVCRNSKCEHRSKPVTPDICKACPLRELTE